MSGYSASALNFSSCMKQVQPPIPAFLSPNPCVPWPSAFNPYNITKLQDFKVSMWEEIILNPFFGIDLNLCYGAADLLPNSFAAIDAVFDQPQYINVPILALHTFARQTLPHSPTDLNGTITPWDIVSWWFGNFDNNPQGNQSVTNFLHTVKNNCTHAICSNIIGGVGSPDITGIGMLISTCVLVVLAIIFAVPSLFGWDFGEGERHFAVHKYTACKTESHDQRPRHLTRVRGSLIGTLDDLLSAIIIFDLAVLISSIIYRHRNQLLYNIFMAETLSLLSSTAMVMVAASYWENNRLRPITLLGVMANSLLTVALFSYEFWWDDTQSGKEGLLMEHICLNQTAVHVNLDDLGDKNVAFPVCFTFWVIALLGSLARLSYVRERWLHKLSGLPSHLLHHALGFVPIVFGLTNMVWLCYMFYMTWREMKKAFGKAFLDNIDDWQFGQFMALVTWLPPVLTFMHLLLAGINNALSSRLPKGWVAFFGREEQAAPLP